LNTSHVLLDQPLLIADKYNLNGISYELKESQKHLIYGIFNRLVLLRSSKWICVSLINMREDYEAGYVKL